MAPIPSPLAIPSHGDEIIVSLLAPHVLLLTLNRPKVLNAVSPRMSDSIDRILNWAEQEGEIWVIIITGTGRAFCAGADLTAWLETTTSGNSFTAGDAGFAAISRRRTLTKPLIAAVNGICFGGGTELVSNCDIVVAWEGAMFALPEVSRGVMASQGGIPRLVAAAGHQLAAELLFTGKPISAREAHERFHIVNTVVTDQKDLVPTALKYAAEIIKNSPDSVRSTKLALLLAKEMGMAESYDKHAETAIAKEVDEGENIKEGLVAFNEKRKPRWKNPRSLTVPAKL